jgi:STE24 endopeptidase
MPFLLLLFLTLVLLPDKWSQPLWLPYSSDGVPEPPAHSFDLLISAALTWLGVALVVATARFIAARVAGRLAGYPGDREYLLSRYGRLRTYHVFALLAIYAVSIYVFGWGWTVSSLCQYGGEMLPGAELLILAPLLAALVLSWVVFYDAERALHDSAELSEADIERTRGLTAVGFNDQAQSEPTPSPEPFWSRGTYVGFHVRQNLALICAPLLLFLLMKGLHRIFHGTEDGPGGWIITLLGVLLSLSVIVGMPWLLRLALGLTPMPRGPLRSRLEATAGRLQFRCNNILVWNTRNGVANAMVAGVVPWVRYVILTDRLMSDLTPDEVEAVFGHEMGHAKHHHMLLYLGFLSVSVALMGLLWAWFAKDVLQLRDEDQVNTTLAALPLVTMLGAYIFVVFGFLSRRCERQADLFGCRAVSCAQSDCRGHEEGTELTLVGPAPPAKGARGVFDVFLRRVQPLKGTVLCPTGIRTFIDALEKVARLNGISRDNPGWLSSWQHSTIGRRVQFLQDVLADRTLEPRFQRRVALVKLGLFLGLMAALAALFFSAAHYGPDEGKPAGETKQVQSLPAWRD